MLYLVYLCAESSYYTHYVTDRYHIMMKCWETVPDDRPPFKQLYNNISGYSECIAGYLKLEYNRFSAVEGVETTLKENEPQNEESKIQSAMSIHEIPLPVDS